MKVFEIKCRILDERLFQTGVVTYTFPVETEDYCLSDERAAQEVEMRFDNICVLEVLTTSVKLNHEVS